MDTEKQLQNLGFTDKEAKVYLACLQLGEDTAFHVARKSGLKRTTAYFTLNLLVDRGLVSVKQTKKATFYSPSNPKKILTQIKQHENIAVELLPALSAMYYTDSEKPTIQVFEGEAGMRHVYAEMIEYLNKGKEILLFGSVKHLPNIPDLSDKWLSMVKNRRFKIRELFNEGEVNGSYMKKVRKNKNPNHQIRIVPEDLGFADIDNVIFGNKLIIFSTGDRVFASVISSEKIVYGYRNLFELAWQSSLVNSLNTPAK